MDKLEIDAPDGELLEVDLPEGTRPEEYEKIVADVLKDYEMSGIETSGLEAGARGLMSGIPGATAAVSGIQALGDKTFKETRRKNELESDKAWDEQPVAYGAGKVAGMAGTAFALPASIPAAVGVGAASGLDASTSLEDMPLDAVKGAAVGGALGKGGELLGKHVIKPLIDKTAPAAASAGKSVLSWMGPEKETIESYLQNPERIRQALSKPQQAEKIAGMSSDLGKASGHLSEIAKKELNPEVAPVIDDLMNVFESAKKKYLTNDVPVTDLDASALKIIDSQYNRLLTLADSNGGIIPEPELRTVIDKLQKMANFNTEGNVGTSLPQKVAGDIQFHLKKVLEASNPKYAAAMKPSAEAAGVSTQMQDLFGIEGGHATDKTVRQVGSLLNEPKIEEQALAAKLKDMGAGDLMDAAKASSQKDEFTSGGLGGAIKTLLSTLGYGTGKMAGIPGAGIGGAGFGRLLAESLNGPVIVRKILDVYIKHSTNPQAGIVKPALQKYGPILANAAKQGGNKLAATYFVLGTSDPEFQKLSEEMEAE